MAKDAHAVSLESAAKFIAKHFRLSGVSIEFDKEDGKVISSYTSIEIKQDAYNKVDWIERNDHLSFFIEPSEFGVAIINGILTNTLTSMSVFQALQSALADPDFYQREMLDKVLDHLGISSTELLSLLAEKFSAKLSDSITKSLPKAQKSYDQWCAKGSAEQAKKERIASIYGRDFVEELMQGILSFEARYIELETDRVYAGFKMMGLHHRYSDEDLQSRARNEAELSWKFWPTSELISIEDVLLRYDVGVCKSYNIHINQSTMTIDGDIIGSDGKRLTLHTVFAGGYNIQRLHTRTLVRMYGG